MMGTIETATEKAYLATIAEMERETVRMSATGVIAMRSRDEHCFDPWWLARCQPGQNRRAATSLARAGFEVWYPAGRRLSKMPHRLITKKKRKLKQQVLREDVAYPYGEYLFIRRLFGSFSLPRLFELDGVHGLCMFAETPAYVQDFEIEVLRLCEYRGEFDVCDTPMGSRALLLAEIRQTEAAKERWKDRRTFTSVLDGSRKKILFVEEFGRITRVIAGEGDLDLPTSGASTGFKALRTPSHAYGRAL